MANPSTTSTDKELLTRAQMRPVWGPEGELIGITELEVASDRRLGIQAMRDLFETVEPGDDVVAANGWTGKQKRIINTKAPNSCHYLKKARRWDTKTGGMVDTVTILLPTEVVWTMFDLLFDGQYSVTVESVDSTDEEIMPTGEKYKDMDPDNMPGRRFYARAKVRLTIHLANGQDRSYEGLGVAFGDIPMHKIGNIAAINNEQRTTEKGAIADAKREALSNIGPVFRRAFEDGDEMIKTLEKMLLEDLQERNRPKIQVVGGREAVPAPRRAPVAAPKPQGGAVREDAGYARPAEIQEDDLDAVFGPMQGSNTDAASSEGDARETEPEKAADPAPEASAPATIAVPDGSTLPVDEESCLGVFLDVAMGHCESADQLDALIEANRDVLDRMVTDRSEIDALRQDMVSMGDEAQEDGIPDFDDDPQPAMSKTDQPQEAEAEKDTAFNAQIEVGKKSGKAILADFLELFEKARSVKDVDRIVELNGPAIRKMTPKQLQTMTDSKAKRVASLKG